MAATIFFAILYLVPAKLGIWRWIAAILAVPPAIFDYLENIGIAAMLDAGPGSLTESLVADTSRWSVLKSTSSTVAMTILLVALIWRGVVAVRRRRQVP